MAKQICMINRVRWTALHAQKYTYQFDFPNEFQFRNIYGNKTQLFNHKIFVVFNPAEFQILLNRTHYYTYKGGL